MKNPTQTLSEMSEKRNLWLRKTDVRYRVVVVEVEQQESVQHRCCMHHMRLKVGVSTIVLYLGLVTDTATGLSGRLPNVGHTAGQPYLIDAYLMRTVLSHAQHVI
jgi:hypothetical protein